MKVPLSSMATTGLAITLAIAGATLTQADRTQPENQQPARELSPEAQQLADLRFAFNAAFEATIPNDPEIDPVVRRSTVASFYKDYADALEMIAELSKKLAPAHHAQSLALQRARLDHQAAAGFAGTPTHQLAEKRLAVEESLVHDTPPEHRRAAATAFEAENAALIKSDKELRRAVRDASLATRISERIARLTQPPPEDLDPGLAAYHVLKNELALKLYDIGLSHAPGSAAPEARREAIAALQSQYEPQLQFLRTQIQQDEK